MKFAASDSGLGSPDPDAAGFVVAGGRSSRMGRDKALLQFGGRSLVECALMTLNEAGLAASIAGARSSLTEFAPVIDDAEPDRGPLGGICAALASTAARHAVFVPVDLPLLPASLVVYLLNLARITGRVITVAEVSGFEQTFPAIVDRAVLPALRRALEEGSGGSFSAFRAATASEGQPINSVAVELLTQSGHVRHPLGLPPVRWWLNVNTPADLERAEALAGARIA